MKRNPRWTAEEDTKIFQMEKSDRGIAEAIRRTRSAITTRRFFLRHLQDAKTKPKTIVGPWKIEADGSMTRVVKGFG